MSITLHLWMLIPGLITLGAFAMVIWQANNPFLQGEDLAAIFAVWLVLMLISGVSIWTAT